MANKLTKKKANKLLEEAIAIGDLTAIHYLLNDSPVRADLWMVSPAEAYDPCYCLLLAAEHNQLDVLKYFLEQTDMKQYTLLKGYEGFVNAKRDGMFDTVNMIYEYIGMNGNIEMAEYVNKNLYLENKYDMFCYASYGNHVGLMQYIIKNDWLTKTDKENLKKENNSAFSMAVKRDSKDSLNFLLGYYKKNRFNTSSLMVKGLVYATETINQVDNYGMFEYFYDNCLKEGLETVEREKIYNKIAALNNVDVYKYAIDKIKNRSDKKRIVASSYIFSYPYDVDSGKVKVSDYPVLSYVIENYGKVLTVKDKGRLFISVIFSRSRKIIGDFFNYPVLTKGIDINRLMQVAAAYSSREDTYDYMEELLNSPLSSKIILNRDHNYLFKMINANFSSEEKKSTLQLMYENCDLNTEGVKKFFQEDEIVSVFLNKLSLMSRLQDKFPKNNYSIRANKI